MGALAIVRMRTWVLVCICIFLLSLAETLHGYPMMAPSPTVGPVVRYATPEVIRLTAHHYGVRNRGTFLRTFCRFCYSQPFFCGEMLELCYARFRP